MRTAAYYNLVFNCLFEIEFKLNHFLISFIFTRIASYLLEVGDVLLFGIVLVGFFVSAFMNTDFVSTINSDISVVFGLHLPELWIAFGAVFQAIFVVVHTLSSLGMLSLLKPSVFRSVCLILDLIPHATESIHSALIFIFQSLLHFLIGCFLYHFVGTVDIVDGHVNVMLDSVYIVSTVIRVWFHKNYLLIAIYFLFTLTLEYGRHQIIVRT